MTKYSPPDYPPDVRRQLADWLEDRLNRWLTMDLWHRETLEGLLEELRQAE